MTKISSAMRGILQHVFGDHRLRRMSGDEEALAAYEAHARRTVIEFGAEVRELIERSEA